jgi:hypothetical protein
LSQAAESSSPAQEASFEFVPLPRIAQISPAFGVVATEVNGDGHPDLYLAQNFYTPQWETGRMDGGVSQLLFGNGDGTFRPVPPSESGLVVPGDAKSLTTADVDGDGEVDFLVGVNASELAVWQQAKPTGGTVGVRLRGKAGNPTAIGARVSLVLTDGMRQTAEVQAGGGYLSQSSPTLWFGTGRNYSIARIDVTWPDGTKSSLEKPSRPANNGTIVVEQAAAR